MVKVSIVVPVWDGMENSIELTHRNLQSILYQNFRDYEIIVSDDSKGAGLEAPLKKYPVKYYKNTWDRGMANNTNHAISRARGELVKILFQDDYFFDKDSLADMVKSLTPRFNWLATGCLHTANGEDLFNLHIPFYSESENTIGSPSVVLFRRSIKERFDPNFHWVLDLDLYKRLFRKYGLPKTLDKPCVVIGLHDGQMTNKLSDDLKFLEHQQLIKKYE